MGTSNQQLPPWASGPGEILRHGLSLLQEDSDTTRRLALIAIDNAVELTIKTYLGLPKRITQLNISRKEYLEISESFPALLDALERYAAEKVKGLDLGEIEWYHRLRNQLYHQGNGLTVERAKVEVYAELANALFKNLFQMDLVQIKSAPSRLLGEFFEAWIDLESELVSTAQQISITGAPGMKKMLDAARYLRGADIVSSSDIKQLERLRKIRNQLVHGVVDHRTVLTPALVAEVKALRNRFSENPEE
jgi:uncharacterized protein YutE (UPF0331/DUF86 family)